MYGGSLYGSLGARWKGRQPFNFLFGEFFLSLFLSFLALKLRELLTGL